MYRYLRTAVSVSCQICEWCLPRRHASSQSTCLTRAQKGSHLLHVDFFGRRREAPLRVETATTQLDETHTGVHPPSSASISIAPPPFAILLCSPGDLPAMTAAQTAQGSAPASASSFDVVRAYHHHLASTPTLPHPIAAIQSLCDLLAHPTSSSLSTVSELISLISRHSDVLKSSLANPIPARAGTDLFSRFVISMDWAGGGGSFDANKARLISVAREFAEKTVPDCRRRICQRGNVFFQEGTVSLVLTGRTNGLRCTEYALGWLAQTSVRLLGSAIPLSRHHRLSSPTRTPA